MQKKIEFFSSYVSLWQSQVSAPAQPNGGNNGSNGNVPPNGQLLTLEEDEEER